LAAALAPAFIVVNMRNFFDLAAARALLQAPAGNRLKVMSVPGFSARALQLAFARNRLKIMLLLNFSASGARMRARTRNRLKPMPLIADFSALCAFAAIPYVPVDAAGDHLRRSIEHLFQRPIRFSPGGFGNALWFRRSFRFYAYDRGVSGRRSALGAKFFSGAIFLPQEAQGFATGAGAPHTWQNFAPNIIVFLQNRQIIELFSS